MSDTEPIFLVACRVDSDADGNKGDHVLATKSFFTNREEADAYVKSVAESRDPFVLRLDGLPARALHALRELAIRDVRRNNEETKEETTNPSDASTS